jgi:hypothetical protein
LWNSYDDDFLKACGVEAPKEEQIRQARPASEGTRQEGQAESRATVTGTERCTRCSGTGDFRTSWGIDGICYTCGGTGIRKQLCLPERRVCDNDATISCPLGPQPTRFGGMSDVRTTAAPMTMARFLPPTLEHSGVDAKARNTRQIDPK